MRLPAWTDGQNTFSTFFIKTRHGIIKYWVVSCPIRNHGGTKQYQEANFMVHDNELGFNIRKLAHEYMRVMKPGAGSPVVSAALTEDTALSAIAETQRKIRTDVHSYLERKGIIMNEKDLLSLDTVDASALFKEYIIRKENKENKSVQLPIPGRLCRDDSGKPHICDAVTEGPAINLIPCFEKGVLKVNKKRYIAWEIVRLDACGAEIDAGIRLYDYIKTGTWQVNLIMDVAVSDTFDNINGEKAYIKREKYYDTVSFLEMVESDLHEMEKRYRWGSGEKLILRESDIPYAKRYEKNTEQFSEYIPLIFFDTIAYVNMMLGRKKIKETRQKERTGDTENGMETTNCNSGKTNEKQGGSDKPEKIVRKLYVDAGEISFKSDTKPRAAGRNTVRSYSMATWKRKGHLRVYKNGKTVYIKEQICHRKGLDGDGSGIPPKLIKVIRKGGTGQDGGSENKKREQV